MSTDCLFLDASLLACQTVLWRSGYFLQVVRAEVVVPQDVQLLLDELGVLLLHRDVAAYRVDVGRPIGRAGGGAGLFPRPLMRMTIFSTVCAAILAAMGS